MASVQSRDQGCADQLGKIAPDRHGQGSQSVPFAPATAPRYCYPNLGSLCLRIENMPTAPCPGRLLYKRENIISPSPSSYILHSFITFPSIHCAVSAQSFFSYLHKTHLIAPCTSAPYNTHTQPAWVPPNSNNRKETRLTRVLPPSLPPSTFTQYPILASGCFPFAHYWQLP